MPDSLNSMTTNQSPPQRCVQNVSTLIDRRRIIRWMMNEVHNCAHHPNPESRIASKAVCTFPRVFRGSSNANRMKARHWWKNREMFLANANSDRSCALTVQSQTVPEIGVKRIAVKALRGRGRVREEWVEYLHAILLAEFERLQELNVKISPDILRMHALHLLSDADAPFKGHELRPCGTSPYNSITMRWIYLFMMRFCIKVRKQSGSLVRSELHQIHTAQLIAFHLGQLQRDFYDGVLEEALVENMDETHFGFNMDNKKTLEFKGQVNVNYADVVSGRKSITLVLRISEGVNSKLEAPFIIFMNKNSNYHIFRVPDNVAGVSYRTGPRGWMDRRVSVEWLWEKRAIDTHSAGERVLFVDNCNGHDETAGQLEAISKINIKLRKLPPNATHFCQPLDSFVLRIFKDMWKREWEATKRTLIQQGDWSNNPSGSEKLNNPGKKYFLRLAAKCTDLMNNMKDSNNATT